MKLPVPKFAILALATCVGLIQQVESAANKEAAQKPMDVNRAEKSSDFEAANNNHRHHGHHRHGRHGHHGHHHKGHHKHHDHHHKKEHHKKHHHKKPYPLPEPESEFCEQIDLICDRVVIDSITCSSLRPIPLLADNAVPSDFEATNNGKKECKITSQRFVNMAFPCYNTPEECSSSPKPGDIIVDPFLIASQDDTNEDTEETDVTDESYVDGEDDEEDDADVDDDETLAGAQSLQKRNNDHKHHHRHHNKKHGHKAHHHYNKKHGHKKHGHKKHGHKVVHHKHHHKGGKHSGHKKDKHPWFGLCTSSGRVCGNSLFGCDFMWSGVYICSHAGAIPELGGICSDGCEQGECTGGPIPPFTTDGPATTTITTASTASPTITSDTTTSTPTNTPLPDECTCTEVGTFCGSSFDEALCSDLLTTSGTNTVYTCKKVGEAPEATQACPARHMCLTKGNTADCGSSTCDCTGTNNLCSSEFKKSCGLKENSIYSCSESGEPKLVSTCEDNEQCVTLTEGAVCASKECKCPKTGLVCGGSFSSTCNLTATALYNCAVVDGEPKITEDCAPGKCVAASVADTADEAGEDLLDFQGDASAVRETDSCILPCTCTSTEDVCGSRFGEDCKLNPSALYSCSGVGETPKEKEVCKSGSCSIHPGIDECTSIDDPCICTEKGSYCGSTFADECEFDPERIYICAANSGPPKPSTNCANGCDGTPEGVCNTESTTTTTTTGTATSEPTQTTSVTDVIPTPTTTVTDGPETTTQSPTTHTLPETTTSPDSTATSTTTESVTTTTDVEPTTGTVTSTPPVNQTTAATTSEVTATTVTVPASETTATITTATTTPAETPAAATPTATTTTTAALTTTTPASTCDTIVNTFKGLINTAFDTFAGFINMIPEPIKSLIAPIITTLEGFKSTVNDALKDAGTVASTAASALSQLVAIATTFKKSITDVVPGIDGIIDTALDILSKLASTGQDVATCLGAPKNCNGLLTILGYILKAAFPLIKSTVAGMGSLVSGMLDGVLTTLEGTIDKLIAGASDAASALKGVVDTISGFASFLPAEAKLPLDILKAILDSVDNCNKGA